MTVMFDRKIFFDQVRASLFHGSLSSKQVEGMEAILGEWELPQDERARMTDLRHLAYPLATTYHECSQKMWPIEEYGRGKGMKYGSPDPETKQTYYGRGFVQLTWRENYARATQELGLKGDADLEWHPEMALDPQIAADVMFIGMKEGWFRADNKGPQTLNRYFNEDVDDAYLAREIINGDKTIVPSWSNGVSIGKLIAGYHQKFLAALKAAFVPHTDVTVAVAPVPAPAEPPQPIVQAVEPFITIVRAMGREVTVQIGPDGLVSLWVDGEPWSA